MALPLDHANELRRLVAQQVYSEKMRIYAAICPDVPAKDRQSAAATEALAIVEPGSKESVSWH